MATTITLPAANDSNWAGVLNTAITTVRDATDAEPAARNTAIANQHTSDNSSYDAAGSATTAQSNAASDAATKYMKNTHMVSTGTIGAVTFGSGAGTAVSGGAASGTDTAFILSFTSGAAPAAGVVATVTFGSAWASAPKVFLAPGSGTSATAMNTAALFLTATTTTVVLNAGAALGSVVGYTFNIFVVA